MAIITFMSDYGHRDHYIASVKAKILSFSHTLNIVDISHQIEPFNVAHAAYILKSVYKDFPKGTVHLVSINIPNNTSDRLLAMKLEEHYFVGGDNGLFSLLSDKAPTAIVELKKDIANNNYDHAFPEKTSMASAAALLANAGNIYNLGPQVQEIKSLLNRQIRISKNQISGNVIHVDNYGNLVTNISRENFNEVNSNRNFIILFSSGEEMNTISDSYNSVDTGEYVALFNSNGLLEIAIREGNGSQLLGMYIDSPVNISFIESHAEIA